MGQALGESSLCPMGEARGLGKILEPAEGRNFSLGLNVPQGGAGRSPMLPALSEAAAGGAV